MSASPVDLRNSFGAVFIGLIFCLVSVFSGFFPVFLSWTIDFVVSSGWHLHRRELQSTCPSPCLTLTCVLDGCTSGKQSLSPTAMKPNGPRHCWNKDTKALKSFIACIMCVICQVPVCPSWMIVLEPRQRYKQLWTFIRCIGEMAGHMVFVLHVFIFIIGTWC